MILRKPYAILIKYFQKIHLLLIFLGAYLFYKTTTLRTFVQDFILTQSYNDYLEPISNYTSFFAFFVMIIVVATIVTLIILLRYKKKPWKLYLFPLVSYLFLFVVFLYTRSYFYNYDEYSTLTSIMAARDLLLIATIPQYINFIIFGIRFLGIDLKKFGFKEDEEYLDIREEDREEFEVNIQFDKDEVVRNVKKFWRNVKYVYFEHQLVCNGILLFFVAGLSAYGYYYFGILHKTYKEGSVITSNNYQIKVNSSYLTERDKKGDLIDENSNYAYMIVNMTVVNKGSKRTMNIDRFRLMNKNQESKYTLKYANYFSDLGDNYDNKAMEKNESKTFSLVFRVKKDLNPNLYVLYYQDLNDQLLVKKTKLKTKDVRTLTTKEKKRIGEEVVFPDHKAVIISNAQVVDKTVCSMYKCIDNNCGIRDVEVANPYGKVLQISFISDAFDSESFIDFLIGYAKINYSNATDQKSVSVHSAAGKSYMGNVAYLKIPGDVDVTKEIELVFTFRDQRYIYRLN